MPDNERGLKHFLFGILQNAAWDGFKKVVGGSLVTTLFLAIYQYIRHRSIDWWGLLVLGGAAAFFMWLIFIKRSDQRNEDKRRTSSEGDASLSREPMREPPVISESDPRIFLEFIDERENQLYKRTFLRLRNGGGSDALDVHVDDIQLRANRVSFPNTAGSIAAGASERFNPRTQDRGGAIDTCFFVKALLDEWNSYNDVGLEELKIPIRVAYENYARTAVIETTCNLVLDPYVEGFKAVRKSMPHTGRKLIVFEQYEFKKLMKAAAEQNNQPTERDSSIDSLFNSRQIKAIRLAQQLRELAGKGVVGGSESEFNRMRLAYEQTFAPQVKNLMFEFANAGYGENSTLRRFSQFADNGNDILNVARTLIRMAFLENGIDIDLRYPS